MCDRIASSPQHNHLPLCSLKRLFFVHNGVSKRGRATRVVSTTVPPSKAYFAFTTVLERRAHVPNDVLGMGVRNGPRENIPTVPTVLQRRSVENVNVPNSPGIMESSAPNAVISSRSNVRLMPPEFW